MRNHVINNTALLAQQIRECRAYTMKRKQDEYNKNKVACDARRAQDDAVRASISTRDAAIAAGIIKPTKG